MTKIYQIGHRSTTEPYWLNDLYDAVQVGTGDRFLPHRDTECEDSIAEWNPIYFEETGVFYVWKECPDEVDYVGITQYRRRLAFDDQQEVEKIFKNYDCILPTPLRMGCSVYYQYQFCHSQADIGLAEKIIYEKYPEFKEGWDAFVKKGNLLYYSSSYVMRRKDFDDWCSFFFGFCEEFRARKGWDTVEKAKADVKVEMDSGRRGKARGVDYQCAVFGFLQERLLTMWCRTRFQKIKEVPFVKFEGV